jgi:hypothetical protein
MRKATLVLLALGLVVASTAFASTAVRISQVYPGSGSGCTWSSKYIELFNSSSSPVDIGGWSLQYGSSTGSSFGSGTYNYVMIPAGATIPACGYFLIKGATSTNGAVLPVMPDIDASTSSGISPSGTGGGKLALFNDQVTGRTPAQVMAVPTPAFVVDVVGWGGSTNCYETAVVSWTSGVNTVVILRGVGGMTDTDNNSTDFTVVSATANPPRNSGSALNPDCQIVPAMSETWGRVKMLYR